MSINASEIQTVVDMSAQNILTKRNIRRVIRDDICPLIACLDALGDDPILSAENADPDRSQIQHVDLAKYYPMVNEAASLISQAYDILADMHNQQTAQGIAAGIVMDAPNGPGGR